MNVGICVRALQLDGNTAVAVSWATLLRDAGHEVTLLTPDATPDGRRLVPVRVALIEIGQLRWESMAGLVRRLGRTFAERAFDVLFVLTGLPIPGLESSYPLLPARMALVPVVLGDRDHVYAPLVRSRDFWNVALVISPAIQHAVHERTPGKLTELVHLAVHQPDPVAPVHRPPEGPPLRLITVGRLFGRKNVLLLPPILAACRRASVPVTLTVVGEGPDREPLEQSCHALGVHDQVEFRRIPSADDLTRAFQTHDVLVWTAGQGEGLGLVLLEAQACGCVPVATHLPGVSDFAIEPGTTGLLARPGDPDDFARQIVNLADPGRRQAMAAAGPPRVRREFSPDRLASELEQILHTIRDGGYPLPQPRSLAAPYRPTGRDRIPRAFQRLLPRQQA